MSEHRYDHLFGGELQAMIARCPVAWVPLGILEKHGEHLPYGLDAFKAHGVCLRLAERLGGVVLPAIHLAGVHEPWDPDPESYRRMRAEVGNFYLRPETLRLLLEDTVDGLANIGFRIVVLYSGHYPQLQRDIVRDVAERRAEGCRVIGFAEIDLFGEGDHAGRWEGSLHIALGGAARLDAIDPADEGVIGYSTAGSRPEQASSAFGERALEAMIEHFGELLKESR